jgi:hypothetical protein
MTGPDSTNTTANGKPEGQESRSWKEHLSNWGIYAAAAGATLAMASSAEASVIYVNPITKPTARASVHTHTTFQIDGLAMVLANSLGSAPNLFDGGWRGTFNHSIAGFFGTGGIFVKNYNLGASIVGGPLDRVFQSAQTTNPGVQHGPFLIGQSGFAGFQLPASKGGGMGWLRIEILDPNHNGLPEEVKAIDWAYNDSGGGITAGQGIPSGAPEPGTAAMTLLAMGAAGVLAWRKTRAQPLQ